ncbi:hypothetical protein Taro_053186 [Colocasia esculenta]|uniref:Uncharacterized protein n=1 Tax=Colocasia esculenta TaxID=4460 RepID=A0A843XLW0_COLES|nr:hypothetical protein [Colocasia esculenta]
MRSNISPQARPPQTSTRSRAHKQNHPAPRTLHVVRELHTQVPPRMTPRNGLPKQQSECESNPRHTPSETNKLTKLRSNHVRPESHDIGTNITDLHEVEKEQPGVTTRDTKQLHEKQCLTTGMATSDLHKVEGPQAAPPCTSDNLRGQGTTHSGSTTDGTKERVTETAVGCLHQAPRENPQSGNH